MKRSYALKKRMENILDEVFVLYLLLIWGWKVVFLFQQDKSKYTVLSKNVSPFLFVGSRVISSSSNSIFRCQFRTFAFKGRSGFHEF